MSTSDAVQIIESYDPRTAGLTQRQYVYSVPGTAPGALVAKTPGGVPVYLNVDASGNLLVSGGSGGGGGSPTANVGAAFPTIVSPVGFQSSTGTVIPLALKVDGSVPVTVVGGGASLSSTSSYVTSVAASLSNITLLAGNSNRVGATVYNTSSGWLFLKLGATANSTTSFSAKLPPEGYLELPFGWKGQIDGLWSTTGGSALVTELV
jgi:hypothetical protein